MYDKIDGAGNIQIIVLYVQHKQHG